MPSPEAGPENLKTKKEAELREWEGHYGPLAEIQKDTDLKEYQEHFGEELTGQVVTETQPKPIEEDLKGFHEHFEGLTDHVATGGQPAQPAENKKEEVGQEQAQQNQKARDASIVAAIEREFNLAPEAVVVPEAIKAPNAPANNNVPGEKPREAERQSMPDVQPPNAEAEKKPSYGIMGRFGARFGRKWDTLVNAPQQKVLETMYNLRSKHAAQAEGRFEESKRELAKAEEALVAKDKLVERARTAGDSTFDAKYAAKMEKERRPLLNDVEQAKVHVNESQVDIEHYEGLKTKWENRQKNLAEKRAGEMDQKLQLPRDAFAKLVGEKSEVNKEIETHRQAKEMHEGYLKDLRARIAANPAAAQKSEIQRKITTVVEMLGRVNNDYNQFKKEQTGIEARMNDINTYLGEGEKAINEQLRITNADNKHAESGGQKREETGVNREAPLSHKPEPSKQETTPTPQTGAEAPAARRVINVEDLSDEVVSRQSPPNVDIDLTPKEQAPEPGHEVGDPANDDAPEKIFEQKEVDEGTYMRLWNYLFKNEIQVEMSDVENLRPKERPWSTLSSKEIEAIFKKGLEQKVAKEENMNVDPQTGKKSPKYTPAQIEDHLKKLRIEYVKQAGKEERKKAA